MYRASPPLSFQYSINLRVRDADLIIGCYQNTHNINENHAYYYRHLNTVDFSGPVESPQVLRDFIANHLPPPLRQDVLPETPTNDLLRLSNLLLHHDCAIRDSCKKHFHLIMKLRLLAKTDMDNRSVVRDFLIFQEIGLGSKLMSIYFMKFVDHLDYMYYLFTSTPTRVLEYFIKNADFNLVPYLVNLFGLYSHDCIARSLEYLFALLTKYGATNIDGQRYYILYSVRNYEREFSRPGTAYFLIENRRQMRVLQVAILCRGKHEIHEKILQLLTASHLEPYLTEEEYRNAFKELVRHIRNYGMLEIVLEKNWDWYKEVLQIEDNAPVTPRTLQDICRYWIRHRMSYNQQLPNGSGLNSLPLRDYLCFKDLLKDCFS